MENEVTQAENAIRTFAAIDPFIYGLAVRGIGATWEQMIERTIDDCKPMLDSWTAVRRWLAQHDKEFKGATP